MSEIEDAQLRLTFADLELSDWVVAQCRGLGMTVPTPVQYNCIPEILKGNDCIGCAKTGSGKTAAFALPILQKLSEDPYGIFALIMTPTRELAVQIADQFKVLGKPIGLKDALIIGGMDMVKQGSELSKKPHVVIATPGRLADHVRSGNGGNFKKVKFLVMDEADRLLDSDNFNEQLTTIFTALPRKRQTLLFSATITDTLQKLQEVAMRKPFLWQSQAEVATVEQLDQRYVLTPRLAKDGYLVHVLSAFTSDNPSASIIIFTSTCKQCQILSMALREVGFPCTALHSMIKQRERLAALAKFKSNVVRILVATDVASRGLDIPQVELVINHNVPTVSKDYIHRVGRTARAGRGGLAITLLTQYDIKLLHAIEKLINVKLVEHPTVESDVMKILTEVSVAAREAEIRLDEQDFGVNKAINKRKKMIMDGKDPDEEEKKKRKRLKLKRKTFLEKRKAVASSSSSSSWEAAPSSSLVPASATTS